MTRIQRWLLGLAVLVVLLAVGGWITYDKLFRRDIPSYASDIEQFKYGSIGNDEANGLPYLLWRVLPTVFADRLPGPGGYASLGFIWEPGHDHSGAPVGFSRARVGFERMAINCAFCHVTVVQSDANGVPALYPGGPSNTTNVFAYQAFLTACAQDPRFTADVLLPAIEQVTQLSLLDQLIYRFVIIPATKKALLQQGEQFAWASKRPTWGPGRIDPFNPVKFGMLKLPDDGTIGNSKMQSVWALDARDAIRANAPLHWDGLNTSIHEVVISSALGDGADAKGFDWQSIGRIEHLLRTMAPPPSPLHPDPAQVQRGQVIYAANCAECHAKGGARTLTVIPLAEIGTNPHRDAMWTVQARDAYNNYRDGYDWGFKSFRKQDGYVAEPLDAIWLKGPYLHNGSVPTLADLLQPVDQRPRSFLHDSTVLDKEKIGFVSPPCTPGDTKQAGFCFDTDEAKQPGNSRAGHTYGTTLPATDKADLIAYLATL
jgi:hypothetical protein